MTSTSRRIVAGMLAIALCASAGTALAQSAPATQLTTVKDWTAWKGTDATGPFCYISSVPTKSEPTTVDGVAIKRGQPSFLILHRTALKIRNEAQSLVGYPLDMNKPITATIDGKTYTMVTEPAAIEVAWLAVEADQPTFVEAMKAGTTLVVKGTSQKGRTLTDTYSLSGVTAAMDAINAACPA